MTNPKTLQISNIIGLIVVITMNTLAVVLPLAGRDTGEISDGFPNLFVPAGYAFSIWSVIYIFLILFIIFQAKGLFNQQTAPEYVSKIGWWFVISCVANTTWIILWHNLLIPFSLLAMLLILTSLIMIYLRLNDGETTSPLVVRLAFSIYLGWITVATVANVTTLLVDAGWNGFGISEVTWTVIVLIVASLIALAVVWTRKDIAYLAVIFWSFIAIVVKRQQVGNPEEQVIITTIYVALSVLLVALLTRLFLRRE